jgi:hypothetical protein
MDGTVSQLRERSNLIEGFLEECCELTDYNRTTDIRTLYKQFVKYAQMKNVSAPEMGQFRYKLQKEFSLMVKAYSVIGVTIRRDDIVTCL